MREEKRHVALIQFSKIGYTWSGESRSVDKMYDLRDFAGDFPKPWISYQEFEIGFFEPKEQG